MRVLSNCAPTFNAPQSQMVVACTTSDTTDDSIFLTSASTTRGSVVSFEAASTPGDAPMRSRKLSMDSVASSVSFEDHCESSPAKARVPDEPQHSLPNDVALGPIMSEALAAVSFGAGAHEARFSRLWTQQHCRELTASFTWHAVCEQFQEKDAATADRIFSHVATAYARALRSARTADQKDTLAWYLPLTRGYRNPLRTPEEHL